jgi:hypothetical protein
MRRSIQWMLSLLAVAGLTSATAARAQPTHQPNTSDKHLATNLGQLDLDGAGVSDGKTMP